MSSEWELNLNEVILIVVGAHPQAEEYDRPLARKLSEQMECRLRATRKPTVEAVGSDAKSAAAIPSSGLRPFILTDLWYLNADDLRDRPIVSIGDPEFNAATAYLANRLPEALVIDGSLRIQLDLEFIELRGCLWGTSPRATASAVDIFIERYLDGFLQAVGAH